VKETIPYLIKNLNRSISYDRSRLVKKWSAYALGTIGLGKPEIVFESVDPLIRSLKIPGGNDGVIYALGCIGYKKPKLVESAIEPIMKIRHNPQYDSAMRLQAIYAIRKILKISD